MNEPSREAPFLIPYHHVVIGCAAVFALHAAAWWTFRRQLDLPFAPFVGLVQVVYVLPLYLCIARRWEYAGLGVRRAAQVTVAAWAFYALLTVLGFVGGGYC